MKQFVENAAETARRRIPPALLPALVEARYRGAWARRSVRADALAQMQFLLGETRPDTDYAAIARAYVRYQVRRGELRWHPELITRLRVVGLDHLQEARCSGRGVMLNFMHHGYYDGAFPSIARNGVRSHIMVYPYMLGPQAPGWLRQHVRVATIGGGVPVSSEVGGGGITGLLSRGEVVAIASDVPGRTPLRFLGRTVLGSSGAARLAAAADVPVIVMTSELDSDGPFIKLHHPLEPRRFSSSLTLLDAMLAVHEAVHLRWPEAADLPLSRWGTAAAVPQAAGQGGESP